MFSNHEPFVAQNKINGVITPKGLDVSLSIIENFPKKFHLTTKYIHSSTPLNLVFSTEEAYKHLIENFLLFK